MENREKDFSEIKKKLFKVSELPPREDKRDSRAEKTQKEFIFDTFVDVAIEYNLFPNFSHFNSVSRGKESQYLREDGTIATNNRNRNHFYDTKSFDTLVPLENKYGNYLNFYFACKNIEEEGGYQQNAVQEIGSMLKCFEKNKDDNMIVFCMLEGPFFEPSLIEEARFDNKRSFHVTKVNLRETLVDVLKTRGLVTDKETTASETNNEEILEALK